MTYPRGLREDHQHRLHDDGGADAGPTETTLAVNYRSDVNGCELLVGLICDETV